MRETLIRKDTQTNRRSDIEAPRADFSWARAEEGLAGLPGGLGLNIAYEAVDRHVDAGRGTETALRWVARDRSVRTFTYEDLSTLSNRFANALIGLGVERGATVFSFLGRVPELFVTALGTWKRGAVFCPLFSAFGPEPIKSRMTIASACVLVTTQRLYQRKVVPILADLPFLKHIILIDGGDGGLAFDSLLRSAGDSFIYISTPRPTSFRLCISRAARPANPKRPCTSTGPSWPMLPQRAWLSISGRAMSIGAPPTLVG
jgi:acetyl-CoA synthetase